MFRMRDETVSSCLSWKTKMAVNENKDGGKHGVCASVVARGDAVPVFAARG